ncbi:RNA polymerase sigma factor [Kribbella antibiotica]|uniref:RNA polymerase sigma factor n=1 Tax=Kribbella antibiotica TaxID=190195 RepID=A0A4R4ZLF9_9ACTN|nr:RNA polymerase sigma factor [Kribbella antibiotica]TDD59050.1 RNA polymerase sigma factor [Kribbella antibiotica]
MTEIAEIGRDPDAFEAFYTEHIERIQRFVARRVDDPYLAADLTADVFLAAIDAAGGYRANLGTPIGWLYGIARNVVSAEKRRHARELRANRRISGRRLLTADDVTRLEERIDAEASARALLRAMDELPPGERAALELVALDGLSPQDAAQVLGIRLPTMRVRLHRARGRLRSQSLHLVPTPTEMTS